MLLGESLDTDGSLNGHVYDFRVWSRALATAEVAPGLKVRELSLSIRTAYVWPVMVPSRRWSSNRHHQGSRGSSTLRPQIIAVVLFFVSLHNNSDDWCKNLPDIRYLLLCRPLFGPMNSQPCSRDT